MKKQWKNLNVLLFLKPYVIKIKNKKHYCVRKKTWIVDAYHYENNQQQKNWKEKKASKNPFHHFWICWKNYYYHYFVQPEPEKSIMLVYNYIYIQKNWIIKAKQKTYYYYIHHTRENYAYNDHDLVTRPLPMNFQCRNIKFESRIFRISKCS